MPLIQTKIRLFCRSPGVHTLHPFSDMKYDIKIYKVTASDPELAEIEAPNESTALNKAEMKFRTGDTSHIEVWEEKANEYKPVATRKFIR